METTFREISQWAGILGSLFYHDPASEKGATALRFVSGQEAAQAWPFGQLEAQTCLETMAKATEDDGLHEIHLEYNRLFIGPSKLPAPAWGSVYLDPENVIFGIETLELREWMRASGVNMTLAEKEPEDQFGLMLMMAAFCTVSDNCSEAAVRKLLEHHLLPWAYRFLDQFEEGAGTGSFYASLAQLTRITLLDWQQRFELYPDKRKLFR